MVVFILYLLSLIKEHPKLSTRKEGEKKEQPTWQNPVCGNQGRKRKYISLLKKFEI
jgi:hypothetical protein